MARGKRLYQKDLLQMNGQKILVTDKLSGDVEKEHTIKLDYDKFPSFDSFHALIDENERYYNISDEPIDATSETKVYELIEKVVPIRGFKIISKEQFIKDFQIPQEVNYYDIKLPKRGTKKSACYDIFSPITFTLKPGEEAKIPTGISTYMLEDEVLKAFPRSGHGFKYYLRLANTVGIIDADYSESDNEGHFWVKLRNEGDKKCTINKGEAMCQVMFQKYLLADDDNFTDGEQRNGGFGSTTK